EELQLQHLRALRRERGEKATLAAPGRAAHHLEPETLRRLVELRHDFATVRPVAAFEGRCVPPHLAQHMDHRRRALAAPPAIDEGAPAIVAAAETLLDVPRDVLRNERRADVLCRERGGLL